MRQMKVWAGVTRVQHENEVEHTVHRGHEQVSKAEVEQEIIRDGSHAAVSFE